MEAICTATTSSGKKCTRCVEKHGAEFCWQHSKGVSKTPSKTPKQTLPSKTSKRGSSKKMSPKGGSPKNSPQEVFQLEQLPPVVLHNVLLNLPRERLNSVCRISRKLAAICSNWRFQEEYNTKHPQGNTMFVGNLSKPATMYDIRTKPGIYLFHDEARNTLTIEVNKEGVNVIEYKPARQFYILQPPENYEPLMIYARKRSSEIIKPGGWITTIQRSNKNTLKAYTGPGYMGDIYTFLRSIGKTRWKEGMNETKEGYIYLSPRSTAEFLTIIKNELDKLWPKKK